MRRNKRRPEVKYAKKSGIGKIILNIFLGLFILMLIAVGLVYKYVSDIIAETPPIENYDFTSMLEENSVIYDNAGNEMGKVEDKGLRTLIPYEKIDEDIIKAIVAVEDKTFFEHKGFNYVRLIGAVIEALKSGDNPSGTSTITQQYARVMYLPETRFATGEEGFKRKIQEAFYTVDIEKNLSKEQILAAYLNTIEFGANAMGIQAACMRYFSKDASDVDYIEAAILAGIPQANTTYSPILLKRRQDVTDEDYILGDDSEEITIVFNNSSIKKYKISLGIMLENNAITKEQYDAAIDFDIRKKIKPTPLTNDSVTSYFIDLVKKEVVEKLVEKKKVPLAEAKNILNRGGLRIHSTMDTKLQNKLESSFDGEDFSSVYDRKLAGAVKRFQAQNSLQADGQAGKATINKLTELKLINKEDFASQELFIGSDNNDVVKLKKILYSAGYLTNANTNLPSLEAFRDSSKNILKMIENDYGTTISSSIMMNKYEELINSDEELIIKPRFYNFDKSGNLVILKNGPFNLYMVRNNPESEDLTLEIFIKDLYKVDESTVSTLWGSSNFYHEKVSIPELHIYTGRTILVPAEYKTQSPDGNAIISKEFLDKNPDFFKKTESGDLLVKKSAYLIYKKPVIQPQASMVIIDYKTGFLKAIAGGRNVSGQMIFNRAISERQPGSIMKPLGVYLPALDNGFNTSSVFEDIPKFSNSGTLWPKNWYYGKYKYYGTMTMREAVEWSVNTIAVKVLEKIGIIKSKSYLKKLGITTLKEDGPINDNNTSALALGGMSRGVKNLEITGAFGTIANGGIRKETVTFTKITDKNGKTILENRPKETFVVNEQVAWLTHDMMKTAAERGFSNNISAIRAGNKGIPVSGKTGTTSNNFDIWFSGYTPYYAASIWIGSDLNLKLSEGSLSAAKYWSKIMKSLHEGLENKNFKTGAELGLIRLNVDSKSGLLPSALSSRDPAGSTIISDWFIPGTQPKKVDDLHVEVPVCKVSNKIASPYCPEQDKTTKVFRKRSEEVHPKGKNIPIRDSVYIVPEEYLKTLDKNNSSKIDYAKFSKNPNTSPYCFIHTGETRTSETTANILAGVQTEHRADGSQIILNSIIVETIFKSKVKVDAGSIIFPSGTILTQDDYSLYPWQIKSFEYNNDGPLYNPNEMLNENNDTDTINTEKPKNEDEVNTENQIDEEDIQNEETNESDEDSNH